MEFNPEVWWRRAVFPRSRFSHLCGTRIYLRRCLVSLVVLIAGLLTTSPSYALPGVWAVAGAENVLPKSANWEEAADTLCLYRHPAPAQYGWIYAGHRATSSVPDSPTEGATINIECHLFGDGVQHMGDVWWPDGFLVFRAEPEILTLSLEPEEATIEPGKTCKFTARVTNQDNVIPNRIVPVTVEVKVDPTSGGHDHGEPPTRDKGSVAPPSGNAEFEITFTATELSGKHTIRAICDECSNDPQTATVNVKVKESEAPDWNILANSPAYELIGGGEGKTHHNNHYLTAKAKQNLIKIVRAYNLKYPDGPVLHLNDASLVWGGKFDISGQWSGSHAEHRRGREIDIRANQQPTAISFWRFTYFKKIAADNGAFASVHCSFPKAFSWACATDAGQNRHFHVRLTGR